jgi:hypothetical protein
MVYSQSLRLGLDFLGIVLGCRNCMLGVARHSCPLPSLKEPSLSCPGFEVWWD